MNRKNVVVSVTAGVIAAVAVAFTGAEWARAASPAIEAAVRTIGQIETDPSKLQSYCKIVKDMAAAGEDEAKFDALEQQMEDLLRSFGPQFEQMLTLAENTDPDTPDGEALEAAFEKLDEKCGS